MTNLRFNGSAWCNLDVALRHLDQFYSAALERHDLNPIHAYVLWALLEQDGQRPSDLAQCVQRLATSFTPLLDVLEEKQLIKRSLSPSDRRSVLIHLTETGRRTGEQVAVQLQKVDQTIRQRVPEDQLAGFLRVVAALQTVNVSS